MDLGGQRGGGGGGGRWMGAQLQGYPVTTTATTLHEDRQRCELFWPVSMDHKGELGEQKRNQTLLTGRAPHRCAKPNWLATLLTPETVQCDVAVKLPEVDAKTVDVLGRCPHLSNRLDPLCFFPRCRHG